jgi:glycine/D-amino acid oxidase-like deaminating enzyme
MPRPGSPYWLERTSARQHRKYPAFRGNATAEVVVIGGGLIGAMATYVMAQSGLDVVLLEADRIAAAGTARGLGVILPQPDGGFREATATAGRRAARIAWTEARRGGLELAAALRRLRVSCGLESAALAINARVPEQLETLRREQRARKDAGLDAAVLTPRAAGAALRSDSVSAIRLRDGFVYDPVRAAAGLVAAAAQRGARVFEQSLVTKTRFTRKHADVVLASGAIRTTAVIVATGGPGTLFRPLRRHVRESEGVVAVTDSMPAAVTRQVIPEGVVMTESGAGPWIRATADGRLLAAATVAPLPARQREKALLPRTAELMYHLSVRYPAMSGLPAASSWDVPILAGPDGLPWIGGHRNYPFHFFAWAFGWHGDGLGWWAARAALRHVRGEARPGDDALSFARRL